jgi:flagellar assembly protein FliH
MLDSGRLIKAHAVRHLGTGATFNYDDLRRQCDEHVALARQEAAEMLARAEAEAVEIRSRAHDEGYASGQQAGLASAQSLIATRAAELAAAQLQDQLRSALPPLDATVRSLENERDRWLTVWESTAVRLSAAIAGKIVRQELQERPELTKDLLREVLQLAVGSPRIRVRMHPLDIEQLRAVGQDVLETLARIGDGALVADESIGRGGCFVETAHGEIDARIETQVQRIADELLGD